MKQWNTMKPFSRSNHFPILVWKLRSKRKLRVFVKSRTDERGLAARCGAARAAVTQQRSGYATLPPAITVYFARRSLYLVRLRRD